MLPAGIRAVLIVFGAIAVGQFGSDVLIFRRNETDTRLTTDARAGWKAYLDVKRVVAFVGVAMLLLGLFDAALAFVS